MYGDYIIAGWQKNARARTLMPAYRSFRELLNAEAIRAGASPDDVTALYILNFTNVVLLV